MWLQTESSSRVLALSAALMLGVAALPAQDDPAAAGGPADPGPTDEELAQPFPPGTDQTVSGEVRLHGAPGWTSEGLSAAPVAPDLDNAGMVTLVGGSHGGYMLPASYTNTSDEPVELVQARFRFRHPLGEALLDATVNPGIVLAGTASGGVMGVGWLSAGDLYHTDFVDGEIVVTVDCAWRLAPGETANLGGGVLWWVPVDNRAHEASRYFAAVGLVGKIGYPRWIDDGILYEASAGGHVSSRFSNVGGFVGLGKQAPYLRDLGVGILWLNAPHEHRGSPDALLGGWNHYDPRDIAAVEDAFGGEDTLSLLISWLRLENDIHVLTEIVPHGGRSAQAEALPQWWTRGIDGELLGTWGGRAMDYASPEWVAQLRAVLDRSFGQLGFEGVRIDVADGSGPNWGSPQTNHASRSTLEASVQMIEMVRDSFVETTGAKFPLIIPESPQTRWEHHVAARASILHYGHQLTQLFDALRREHPTDPAALAARLQKHFIDEQAGLPLRARVIRTTANHDTVVEGGRAMLRLGPALARSFHAVCVAADGVPMLYQEEEVGQFHDYLRLHAMRRRVPEMGQGQAYYTGMDAGDPRVFVVQHISREAAAVAIVNLSPEPLEGRLRFPPERRPAAGTSYYHAWSGQEQLIDDEQALAWSVGPHDATFYRIGLPPVGEVPELRWDGEPDGPERAIESFDAMMDEKGLRVSAAAADLRALAEFAPWAPVDEEQGTWQGQGATARVWRPLVDGEPSRSPRLRVEVDAASPVQSLAMPVRGARDWMVSTTGVVLFDATLRRHWPFPEEARIAQDPGHHWGWEAGGGYYDNMYPWGRFWESLQAPLHPDEPALAFRERNGLMFQVRDIQTNAANIMLVDGTDEGDQFRLELRFLREDLALAPHVRAFGPGQPWRLAPGEKPPAPDGPLVLEMEFAFSEDEAPGAQMTAPRLPMPPVGARLVVDAPQHSVMQGIDFLPEPGALRWEGLAPVPGQPRPLRLLARHSEASADGRDLADAYEIRVGGQLVPHEWTELGTRSLGNAYLGWIETAPVDLSAGEDLEVRTLKPWAAARMGEVHLGR